MQGSAQGFARRTALWVREHGSIAGAVAAVALVLGLYARTLTFGFFGDDPSGYFRWMEGASWSDLFTSSPGFFLRPMVFVVSKLLLTLAGGYVAPAFHASRDSSGDSIGRTARVATCFQ